MDTQYAYVVFYEDRHESRVTDKVFLDRKRADAYVDEMNQQESKTNMLDRVHFSHIATELVL